MKDKTLIMVDASALKGAACSLRLHNTIVHGYRKKLNTIQIEFGQAFHKFRAIFRKQGMDVFGDACQAAVQYFETTKYEMLSHKKYMTKEYLIACCGKYAVEYMNDKLRPIALQDDFAIELPFCIPYYQDDLIEVLLAGTIDELSVLQSASGMNVITDCKVTSLWDIDKFLDNFLLSSQLLFYRFIVKEYGKIKPDSFIGEVSRNNPALLVDALNTKGKDEIYCVRSKPWIVTEATQVEFENLLHGRIAKLIDDTKHWIRIGNDPAREGMLVDACDGKYDKCQFFTSCCMGDTDGRRMYLDSRFIKQHYNPLQFGEQNKKEQDNEM